MKNDEALARRAVDISRGAAGCVPACVALQQHRAAPAQDELQSVLVASHNLTGGRPLTPKEVEQARIQERQKYLDMLDTRLDATRAGIDYPRQAGKLQSWLDSINPAASPK